MATPALMLIDGGKAAKLSSPFVGEIGAQEHRLADLTRLGKLGDCRRPAVLGNFPAIDENIECDRNGWPQSRIDELMPWHLADAKTA